VINNFSPLGNRNDTGALWENYLVVERLKYLCARDSYVNRYFWRTTRQQEIDYLEEADGKLSAYEFKWQPLRATRFSSSFLKTYPGTPTAVVTPRNYVSFLS
jgi:hypothetical protein